VLVVGMVGKQGRMRLVILSRTKQGESFAIVVVYRYTNMDRNKLFKVSCLFARAYTSKGWGIAANYSHPKTTTTRTKI
jgi:hypothetical protein